MAISTNVDRRTLIKGTVAAGILGAVGAGLVSSEPALADGVRTDLKAITAPEFSTLDPQKLPSNAEILFCTNIFDGLVGLTDDGEVYPKLATSWTASDDGLSYTFTLRQGVKFHDGSDFTVEDAKFSVDRFAEETWMEFCAFPIESSEIVDDQTLKVNLSIPYGKFLSEFWYCEMVSKKYYESMSEEDFGRKPMGTGPYKFVEWATGQYITLEANEEYWDGAPTIKNVKLSFISDVNTALVALETGEGDFAYNSAVTALTYQTAEKNDADKLAVSSTSSANFYYVNFNIDRVSPEVRRALSYAIDREAVNTLVFEGYGVVGELPLLEGQEGYTEDLTTYPYDPAQAQQLLNEAGESGAYLTFYYSQSGDNDKLAQALQGQLANIGVTLELQPVESSTWWSTFTDGNYDLTRGGYPMEIDNTDTAYFDMFHSTGTFNLSQVKDPAVDEKLEAARVSLDATERDGIYQDLNRQFADDAYYIPLYWGPAFTIYNKDLKGAEAKHTGHYEFKNFSW